MIGNCVRIGDKPEFNNRTPKRNVRQAIGWIPEIASHPNYNIN